MSSLHLAAALSLLRILSGTLFVIFLLSPMWWPPLFPPHPFLVPLSPSTPAAPSTLKVLTFLSVLRPPSRPRLTPPPHSSLLNLPCNLCAYRMMIQSSLHCAETHAAGRRSEVQGVTPRKNARLEHFAIGDTLTKSSMLTYFVLGYCMTRRRADPAEGQLTRVTVPKALQERVDIFAMTFQRATTQRLPMWYASGSPNSVLASTRMCSCPWQNLEAWLEIYSSPFFPVSRLVWFFCASTRD